MRTKRKAIAIIDRDHVPIRSGPLPQADGVFGTDSRAGDAANVILTAVGYNLRLVLAWLRALLRLILDILLASIAIPSPLKPGLLTAD